MDTHFNPVAATDQAIEDAKHTARILAAFNLQLVKQGVHEVTADGLTKIYAARVFNLDKDLHI